MAHNELTQNAALDFMLCGIWSRRAVLPAATHCRSMSAASPQDSLLSHRMLLPCLVTMVNAAPSASVSSNQEVVSKLLRKRFL